MGLLSASCVYRLSLAAAALLLVSAAAPAQSPTDTPSEPVLSAGFDFSERGGEQLYANVCQACHMAGGNGAMGAGRYPSLAGDAALAAGSDVIDVVVNGRRAMPPVGAMMTNDQVAAIVNYVRTHFGNDYRDAVSAEGIESARRQSHLFSAGSR